MKHLEDMSKTGSAKLHRGFNPILSAGERLFKRSSLANSPEPIWLSVDDPKFPDFSEVPAVDSYFDDLWHKTEKKALW